jgi:hypothetical protein
MTPQHAAYVLAQQRAIREVRRRIKKSGGNLSAIPYSRLTWLGREWLEGHPEMIAEALELATELVPQRPPVSRRRAKAWLSGWNC